MKAADFTPQLLKQLGKLILKKEKLLAALVAVDGEIAALDQGKARKPRKKRRKLSAAAKAAIAEGQRKRRAKEKAGN